MGCGDSEREKNSKEKNYNKGGEKEHREKLKKLRNLSVKEYRKLEFETLRTSWVSLLSCFINFCARRLTGNLEDFFPPFI